MELGARCIGHVKSHLKTETGTIKADTIGVAHGAFSTGTLRGPSTPSISPSTASSREFTEDAVKAATLEGMHEVADQRGLAVVKEKEHTYFDEFDFVATKKDYIKQLEEQLAGGTLTDTDEG